MNKKIFSILDFGAVPGVEQLQTDKIQEAVDKCFLEGGGIVEIPEGVFMTGGFRLRSNVTLYLKKGACLKGSTNPEDYMSYHDDKIEPLEGFVFNDKWSQSISGRIHEWNSAFLRNAGSRWNNGLIKAINAENIAIIGEEGSMLDGSDCFDELGEEHYRGPHCINMFNCKNVTFSGYTVKDSANWAHAIFRSENIVMDNVTVLAGHDGAHFTVCTNITVTNCKFYTGDDCVAGFANVNVTVSDCELNSACSAMRFGGTNVLVEKCHIYGPCKYLFRGSLTDEEKRTGVKPALEGHRNNMLSVFTYYSDFSVPIAHQPGNIIIKDCKVDFADRFLHYNFSGNEPWQASRPLESIRFENITATDISMPLTAYGDKDVPITLDIKNVDISIRKGFENIDFMHIANHKKISLENVRIDNYSGKTLMKAWTEGNVEINNLTCDVSKDNYVHMTDEEFVCMPI